MHRIAIVTAGIMLASLTTGANALPLPGGGGMLDVPEAINPVENAQVFVYRGRAYCFYLDGWNGPGWYRCGFAWRRGIGWGGVYGVMHRATDRRGPGTVYTFALGGTASPPAFVEYQQGALVQGVAYNPEHVKEGTLLYVSNCVFCHGVPGVDRGGNIKNLGYSSSEAIANLDRWVFKGPATEVGMPDYTGKLTAEQVEKIKAFIQGTADAIRPKK